MTKITVKQVDGKSMAVATVNFDIGEVHKGGTVREVDGQKVTSVIAGMNIDGMVNFYRQLVYERALNENEESFDECLESYVTFRINQIIGVKDSPLQFGDDGKIKGLDDSVVVEIEGESKEV